jgi:predicted dienelactone hydrolase
MTFWKTCCTALWLGASAALAQTQLGLQVLREDALQAHKLQRLTVFYGSSAAEQTVTRGPFQLSLAADGAIAGAPKQKLIVVSHGSGGSAWTFADIARTLVRAGYVVAVPKHSGDNSDDQADVGPPSWRKRPQEISAAIDALAAHPAWGQRLDTQRVGVFGMSAGGLTTLVLAGGVWSEQRFGDLCRSALKDNWHACVGLTAHLTGGMFDGVKLKVAAGIHESRFVDPAPLSHHDPRIAAAVSAVPMAAPFDPQSLAKPRIPLGIIRADKDAWLVPQFHSDRITSLCLLLRTCEMLADWREGGHASVLSPWPKGLGESISPIMTDPPGFDRERELPRSYDAVTRFFNQHLQ